MRVHRGITGILSLILAALVQAQETQWVPYTATFTETVVDFDASGTEVSKQVTGGKEFRADDGSVLIVKIVKGEWTTGELQQGNGQIILLDYLTKRAVLALGAKNQRRHPYVPPEPQISAITIGGITFLGYSIHMDPRLGAGTIWMDWNHDIQGKLEYHFVIPDGRRKNVVRQLTALDLTSPVDGSLMQIPAGFTVYSAAK